MTITSNLQIPKRIDTQQLIRDASQSDKEQLQKLIDNCFLERKYRDVIYQNFNDVKIVNNPLLQERFKSSVASKRDYWKAKDKELFMNYTFYYIKPENSDELIDDFITNGPRNEPQDASYLGISTDGLHVCTKLDTLLISQYKSSKSNTIKVLVLKTCYAKPYLELYVPGQEPNFPNTLVCDAILSSDLAKDEKNPLLRYIKSTIFLFDYDVIACGYSSRISNLLPHAILTFKKTPEFERELDIKLKHFQKSSFNRAAKRMQQQRYSQPADDFIPLDMPQQIRQPITINSRDPRLAKRFQSLNEENVIVPDVSSSSSSSSEDESDIEYEDFDARIRRFTNAMDLFKAFERCYGNPNEAEKPHTNRNLPKWRLNYERTGRWDIKFKGAKRVEIKLPDLRSLNLNFDDEECTKLSVNKNRFKLDYLEKRKTNAPMLKRIKIEPRNIIKEEPEPMIVEQTPAEKEHKYYEMLKVLNQIRDKLEKCVTNEPEAEKTILQTIKKESNP